MFHDVDAVRPELRRLEENIEVIRSEFAPHFAEREKILRYHELDPRQTLISADGGNWRVLPIDAYRARGKHYNRKHFPKTAALLDGVPDLYDAFFSILEPGKSIRLHSGPYLGYLRYHLGLSVPKESPPRIEVAGRPYTWRSGESVIFDDSYPHQVFNEANECRVVLIVDFLRPMPRPLDLWNRCMAWTPRL